MMSMLVNNIIDKLENKPEYRECKVSGKVTLEFKDAYALQDFIAEIRKQGLKYGFELATIGKEHELCRKKAESKTNCNPRIVRDWLQA